MKIAAVILTGGKALRLGGVVKGLLTDAAGVCLIQRLIGELAAAGIHEVLLAANDPRPYERFGKTVIGDVHPGVGPLGGIEAALRYLAPRCDSVLFLPCDVPNISAREIEALRRAHELAPGRVVLAETAQRRHPLCAVVPIQALSEVAAAIQARRYGVDRLWRALGAAALRIDDSVRMFNVNTPEDLRQWRQTVRPLPL